MGLLRDKRVTLLFGAFLLTLLALLAVGTLGILSVVAALFNPAYAGDPLLFVLLDAAAPYVVATVVLGGLSFLLSVGVAVAAARQASMPRDDRLARLARTVERHSPEARRVGLAERFEPTTEERIEELKQRYVEGEITELEYERRLGELMDEEGVSDERVRRETSRTDFEFEK